MLNGFIARCCVCFSLFMLAGCETAQIVSSQFIDPRLELTLVAHDRVNLDGNGRPSPVVVKVMQLRARDTLENLDFERSFYEADKWLGDDLLFSEDVFLQPKQVVQRKIDLKPDVAYIAVIAGYRKINTTKWKFIHPMPNYGSRKIKFTLGEMGVVKGDLD